MPIRGIADIQELKGRLGRSSELTDGPEDISGGTERELNDVTSTTLYLHAEGAVSITVEGSPDSGDTWYVFSESPISFESAGDKMIHWPYNLDRLRLSANNGTAVRAQVREVV